MQALARAPAHTSEAWAHRPRPGAYPEAIRKRVQIPARSPSGWQQCIVRPQPGPHKDTSSLDAQVPARSPPRYTIGKYTQIPGSVHLDTSSWTEQTPAKGLPGKQQQRHVSQTEVHQDTIRIGTMVSSREKASLRLVEN
ncbi:hypothetical protein H920_11718 [Fukomys damarensis]|uniref:Uncharacterized protein n=1 Tax=Fukomys damarensis TaxID=885580 RepID=A0A091DVR7_FUKDA|nr:hypothetical protein H920_11718 [Fukomys damarensis]